MSAAPLSNRLETLEIRPRAIEPAQQTAAKVAGFAYLFTFAGRSVFRFPNENQFWLDIASRSVNVIPPR